MMPAYAPSIAGPNAPGWATATDLPSVTTPAIQQAR
jgi:hypothetical protein